LYPAHFCNWFSGAILEAVRPRKHLAWAFGSAALILGLAFTIRYLILEQRARNQRAASAAIKTLTVAAVDFRSNDRDGNQVNDFWTGDVAGLYSLSPPNALGPHESIKLITRELAEADAAPLKPLVPTPRPYHGYLFRAMVTDENGIPYASPSGMPDGQGAAYNNSKFGFCAYPADPGTGMHTFTVNEGNTIFKLALPGPILKHPDDTFWSLLFRRTSYEPPPLGLAERVLEWWARSDSWLLAFGIGGFISLGGWGSLLIAPRRPGMALLSLSVALIAVVLMAVWGRDHTRNRILEQYEENAAGGLNLMASANHHFRSEDWDGNNVADYWTGDIFSLMLHERNQPGLGWIAKNLASADGARPSAQPFRGYLFRAVPMEGDGAPGRNRLRFAFCAYPADYGRTGSWTFLVSESSGVLRKDTGGQPLLEMPPDGEGWEPVR